MTPLILQPGEPLPPEIAAMREVRAVCHGSMVSVILLRPAVRLNGCVVWDGLRKIDFLPIEKLAALRWAGIETDWLHDKPVLVADDPPDWRPDQMFLPEDYYA